MNKSDHKDFAIIMARMAAAYQKEVSKMTAEVYFEELYDLPIDKIRTAVRHVCRTKKISTLPTIGEIRGFIVKDVEELALEAWHKANRAILDAGIYVSVCFDDKVIHSVIDNEFGGWDKFCNLSREGESWDCKRFIRAYCIYSDRKDHPEYLPGIHEKTNEINGYDKKQIVQIGGDKEIKKLKGGEE